MNGASGETRRVASSRFTVPTTLTARVEARLRNRTADIHLGREVEDRLGAKALDELGDRPCLAQVGLDQLGSLPERIGEVLAPSGREVVQHGDLVTALEQRVDQIRADEARAARDQ